MSLTIAVQSNHADDTEVEARALPLSLAQERLWFLAQIEGVSEAYHIPMGLRLSGELDRYALKRALDRIVWRHEALRTSFQPAGGQPVQRIAAADSGFELQEHDITGHRDAASELERRMREEASRRFDLERGPLIRGQLIRLAAQEHVLLITMHHIVSDGWSMGVLTNELSALYRAYRAGGEDPLPPLAIQYADYAVWQRQRLSGELQQRQSEYWRGALAGAPALLELPTDRPRPAQQSFAGDVVDLQLDAVLTRGLKALCQRHGMTLYMLVVAGWAAVLSRLSGQEEVVIGTAIANRTRPEIEGLIGFFVNTQALRVAVSGSVAELLERVRERTLDAQEHQDLPFEQVVEIVKPPRSMAYEPIFQVRLMWDGKDEGPRDFQGLKLEPVQIPYGVAKFDLELDLGEVDDRIQGGMRYATALFDRDTIERHLGYLREALAAMVADEYQAVDRIDLLSDAERGSVLELGNGGPSVESIPGSQDVCLYDLVAEQAERSPEVIAVIELGGEITYRQLVERANGVGQRLSELGIGPESRVAILTDRSAESLVGVLGILASGAAYVPLDPSYPDERIAFVLDDASVRVLLTPVALVERANHVARRAAQAIKVVVIAAAPAHGSRPDSAVAPANAAYVIYTSGSTGTPKGVVIDHRGVMNLVQGFLARHDFAGHRLLMIPPLVFDASVGDVFPVLAVGATLVLHPAPAELGSLELQQFCREFRITAIDAPAALWRGWTEGFAAYADNDAFLPGSSLMMIGGESVSLERVRRFAQLTGKRVVLANHYGPTEASVCATMLTTRDGSELSGADLPIGRPLPGVRVYVLDQYLRLAPRGAEGELCIGGAGVARGYLGLPELSAERFVRDPFSPDAAARMYRTGDLVRWNADGTLQFIGRRDHQVKIRGLRIELGEIEARLAEHPSVGEAVVLAREDQPGDKRLVAYITSPGPAAEGAAKTGIDVEALRVHIGALLPEYMVPAAYVGMAKFPLTANGKLDRKALPAPDADAYVTRGYDPPMGEVETAVARIWAEVLKLERVGRNDNFFELGGHSLLAVTVIERMREAALPVDVRALFAAPTLKALAEAIGGESRTVEVPPNLIPAGCTAIDPAMLTLVHLSQSDIDKIVASVPGGAGNVQDIYPLTPLQEGLLFHHLLGEEGDVYLAPTLFGIDTREHVDRYVETLQVVIDRHDILRTAVVWEGLPEPMQVVWRHAPLSVEEVTLDAAAGDIAEQLRNRFDPRRCRLDVRQAPLWRLFIAEDVPNNRWVLLELMHHLVGDHVTLQVMQQEIQTILGGKAERLPAPLPFRNFVAQARLGVSREEHEAFFTRMLGDVDEPTAPFGLTDVQGDGSQIVEASREVNPQLCQRLRAQARALGVTAASVCHLAWALVLARASGRDDVVFGTVMFGRMQGGEGADRVMGIFINTLPVRIQVGDEGARASVRKTHELLTQLFRHEHAPLALVQRCSAVRAPAPLFTSLLNYRYVGGGEAVLVRDAVSLPDGGQPTETWAGMQLLEGRERSNYPFDVSINDLGEGLSLDVQVDGSIDPQRVCALMHTALESLVTALECDPSAPVCRLDVLPPAERHRLLVEWNATASEYPSDRCIHELFEAQAERTPGAAAVEHEGQQLTYAELDRRANQLGWYLRKLGVGPDMRVGICMERGLEMIVGLLGVLKAGAGYVPLDPVYPIDRLAYLVRDVQTETLLTQSKFRDRLPNYEGRLIELDRDWQIISQESGSSGVSNVRAENLAYVIYTSGSTGKPKGVAVEHRQVCNQLFWAGAALDFGPADRVLQKTSFSVDASIVEIFVPLVRGARIIIAKPGGEYDVDYLARLVFEKAITYVDVVPALLRQLLDHPVTRRWTSLRVMCCGGDVLKPELVRAFYQSMPGVLWNAYGPTETTVQSTFTVCTEDGQTVPIGKPIANTQIYILDEHRQLAPVGVAGELYIGGAGVARGYLHRPELTAERFLADPFSADPGGRMYRTGDVGRFRPDGNIEYLGRNDHQVKIRGFRIELGEIEARLAEHPSVREAVVLAREDHPGDKRLVAYVTATGSTAGGGAATGLDVEALRAHLSAQLPEYMVPAAYVGLAKLPLTANGKLDRKALPAPDADAYVTRGYEAPVGEVETAVARIWAEVLKLERVGRNDNFFELGGHSLLAVTVISRLRWALQLDVGVKDLFAYPVLVTFANAVRRVVHTELAPVTPASRDGVLPLSFAQQRLWFLAQMEGVSEAYHIPMGLRLSGDLDRHALKRALDRIVWRHEALRTSFQPAGGQPVQRIAAADSGFELQEHDITGHREAALELERRMREEAGRRFDLERGPLIRGQLIRLAAQEHVLLITMHHIVSDGWSMGVLTNELSALYRAYRAGGEDPLPPLAIQYADYAVWQRQRLSGELQQRQSEYWRGALAGAPALLELPTDRPRPAQQSFAGDVVDLQLDAVLTRGLKALCQRHGMTLYMLVVAGWAAVLSRLSGQEEVVIGTAIANRTRPEIEGLIGFFVNTQALRVADSGSVSELLERVKGRTLDAQEHQDLPFEQVVEIVKPPRSMAHAPIFQAMLVWESNDEGILHLPGLRLEPAQITYGVAKFDLELDLGEVDDRIQGGMRYATALFDRDTIERHLGYLREALAAMVADGRQAVDRIDLLSDAERGQLLVTWNDTSTEYAKDRCIHQLFEAQAAQAPDAIAVAYEGQTLTYGELNRQANQLAHYLRGMGVRPDDRVALCAERSLEMVVGILAVLKAGGGYVPLDPAYPVERLEYMLADSAPAVLLVHLSAAVRTALSEVLTTGSIPVVDLQADASAWADGSQADLNPGDLGLQPQNLAYVIYTSGSTGKPKGVMVEHGNVVRLFSATQDWFHFDRNDVWTLFHSYAFDFSVWEIWGALVYGGKLVVVPQLTTRSPQEFYSLLCAEGVTILNQTPSAFRQLIAAQAGAREGHRLRHVIFGGEALEVSTLRPWYQRETNRETRLINMYGITETTVHVTYRPLTKADTATPGPSPIGCRIPDLTIYILDEHRQPVPVGVAGELYVGGAGVARGYLNRPELTAERFLADPFGGNPGGRMYRTGDVGRFRADGQIEYLGRNDHQVKIRGFRIELGEIEARLAEHPSVREAVVLAREDHPGDKRLVAYVTASEALDVESLRDHLSAQLPEYMVPAAYVGLAKLPLTANGKLDRKALPTPDADAYVTRGYDPPVGEVETTVARIWAQVLKLERVGRNDNFFELGGHSLLAVTVIERMREAGLPVDVRALFSAPTLKGLAEAVGGESRTVEVPPNLIPADGTAITPAMLTLVNLSQSDIDKIVASVPGGARNVQDIYPLAPLQEGILFHHLLEKEGDVYLTTKLLGAGSRERLDRYVEALQVVIDRHDILRTAVVWEGLPEPVQVVWRHAPLSVEEITLDAAAGDIAEQLRNRFDARQYRLDVSQAPMWRLFIAEDVPNNRWVMLELTHHLVDDNTSVRFLLGEIQTILRGEAERLPAPLPFRNFVAQARLGVSREEHEAFFTRMLGDVDEPTAPFGLTDVQGDGSQIVEASREVDPQLCQRLRAQARAMGVTSASVCHLAWALVLARATGRDDVVFGTVMFGRMQGGEGADRVMGIFINTLPLRIHVGDAGVRASVRQTHELLTQLFRHEHAPLALAQRCSAVRAPAPLFTSLFNYRYAGGGEAVLSRDAANLPDAGQPTETWASMQLLEGRERSNYPFDVSINDLGQRFSMDVQVDPSVDPEQVCACMQTALESLVTALERDPAAPVCGVDVLPAAERHRLLVEWNATEAEYPRDLCIHELLEAQAARIPQAVAVVDQTRTLTYEDLNRQANQLAHRLRSLGVQPDDRVALCAERSLEMVVGILGILKAGAGYVPLDPAYPAERLVYMLEDAAPKVLLTQARWKSVLPEISAPVVVLESATVGANDPTENVEPFGLTPGNLAYVIYTSGSTGKPKGVMVEHRNVVNLICAHVRNCALTTNDRVLQFASFGFDASVEEIFAPLSVGASVVLRPPELMAPDDLFFRFLRDQRITVAELPTAFWHQWAQQTQAEGLSEDTDLRLVVVGGEKAERRDFDHWRVRAQRQKCSWLNTYGPTEATVYASALLVEAGDELDPGDIPIGRPVVNARIYILDEHRQPVPVGVAGELYVGGAGVARGYLHRPELTAERFLADPFCANPGGRMYRTGDVGRFRADGQIEYLGRNDHQVKIRGFRIELGEIEARLAEHPSVREAVVLAREDHPGDKRLVAYVTAAESLDVESLRDHLSAQLPEYMVPAAYVGMAKLPLTANGKLDRKALPAPDADAYVTRGYEAPVGEVETTVARIWAEVLMLERVGRNDNFFELGGHSLLAVSVTERMREAGLPVDVRALFSAPTLKGLAEAVGGESRTVEVPPNLIPADGRAITPAMLTLVNLSQSDIDKIVASVPGGAPNVQDIYPLAPLQEGILFHHLLEKEGDVYLTTKLLGAGSRERLDRYVEALQVVIDRHDILRTAVVWEGLPEPVQVVWRHAPLHVEEITLDAAAGDIAEQLRNRFDPRHYRLDVRQAPLWRLFIAEDVANNRWVMLELTHHLVDDNTSGNFLLAEIQTIMRGEAERLPAPLPFRNFVAQARLGVSREEHEAFFTSVLGDVDEPTAPFGLTDVQGDGSQIVEASREVDPQLCQRLRAQAGALGVTAASVCHLAWALVLARTSGRDDVVFGTVMFGRMQGGEGADRVVGLFINTVPVRIQVGDAGVRASVRKTHELLTQLFRHEHAPLALAQRCSAVPAPRPLFSALLNYRHSAGEAPSAEAQAEPDGIGTLYGEERTNYPLSLSVDDLGEGLMLTAQAPPSIGPLRVCNFMHRALESLVAALETAPATAVRRLEVLPESERHQVLYGWNETDVEYPSEKCIHQLFEEQVEKTPQAIAAIDEDTSLSYAELNQRANRLAHHVRGLGAQTGDRVVVLIDRSIDLIVSELAILKCGAAYVPVDPAYPGERKAFMITDSEAKIVLSTEGMELPDLPNVTRVDVDKTALAGNPAEDLNVSLDGEAMAYLMYTSGSTGQPKGVMVPHRAIKRLVLANGYARFEAGDRVAFAANPAFDASTMEVWAPLLNGGRIVVIAQDVLLEPSIFGQTLKRHSVNILWLTVGLFNQYADTLSEEFAKLRYLIVGGDVLDPRVITRVLRTKPPQHLINGYGPTETTTFAITHEITVVPENARSIPIGRPIANTRVYILDRAREPVPVGVTGELYIGGAGVARGYLNRPELTAERFLPDPFITEGEGRMYKTGDLGRWLEDGTVEFLGRNDFQVKIRGFRLELGEIEARLSEHPSVREAVVLAREDQPGNKRLVAYVTAIGSAEDRSAADGMDVEPLRAHLSALLPEYMVPAAYVWLAKLPLTANGKLDRKALPAPNADAYLMRGYEAPVGELETTVARIWAEVLKLDRVGRNDNFFEIGGHSLLVVRMTSMLRQFGIETTVAVLFNHPTVESFAKSLNTSASAPRRGAQRIREGTETPIFLVHDGYGDELYFSALAQYLPRELPVYGLPAVPPGEPPLHTMRAMAQRMVHLIQQVQEAGPYKLAGWSFGGVLAYEIAQQLLDRGHELEFLGLMDAFCPDDDVRDAPERTPEAVLVDLCEDQRMVRSRGRFVASAVDEPDPSLGFDELFDRYRALQALPENFEHLSSLDAREQCRNLEVHSRAMAAYRPRPIDVPVHLFVAGERPGAWPVLTASLGWERCVPEHLLHVQAVPGSHHSMMRPPHITVLGRGLTESLAEVEDIREYAAEAVGGNA